jgi:hypothetical protein
VRLKCGVLRTNTRSETSPWRSWNTVPSSTSRLSSCSQMSVHVWVARCSLSFQITAPGDRENNLTLPNHRRMPKFFKQMYYALQIQGSCIIVLLVWISINMFKPS